VSWFNHHRLLEPLGYIPPAEAEANYYKNLAVERRAVRRWVWPCGERIHGRHDLRLSHFLKKLL
jgi:hypothetical protein